LRKIYWREKVEDEGNEGSALILMWSKKKYFVSSAESGG